MLKQLIHSRVRKPASNTTPSAIALPTKPIGNPCDNCIDIIYSDRDDDLTAYCKATFIPTLTWLETQWCSKKFNWKHVLDGRNRCSLCASMFKNISDVSRLRPAVDAETVYVAKSAFEGSNILSLGMWPFFCSVRFLSDHRNVLIRPK